LCLEIPNRRVGSDGNLAATDFFAKCTAEFGFRVECPVFDCIDWICDGFRLAVGGDPFEAQASPYSLGCQVRAPLAVASTMEELEAVEAEKAVLLLRGELAKEQLMPKNFPFYNPEEHKRIIGLLEKKAPLAILAATSRNPELAGGMYPFPLIEDGDFDIPSAYMTEEEGNKLTSRVSQEVLLDSRARRIPASGCNVIAQRGGGSGRRVVFLAHIDSKAGTPGALDNAAGVVTLLLLARLLNVDGYAERLGVEIVALNGEDYYASPGEIAYLAANQGRLSEILLGINLDAVGYREGKTAYSLYGCPDETAASVRKAFASRDTMVEGEAWYQSDHMILVQNGVPAVAITSDRFTELSTYITHTEQDRPELVDPGRLVDAALALRELLLDLE
jgi:aminopeptidase YwaD